MPTSVLLSKKDSEGPHRYIIQPDLRLLWRKEYEQLEDVPWDEFWSVFPKKLLGQTFVEEAEVQELCQLLHSPEAQKKFQWAVGGIGDRISIWELKRAFKNDAPLLQQVKNKVGGGTVALTGRVQLPDRPPNFFGRDEDAERLVSMLTSGDGGSTAVLLLAEGGIGKSTLATDVGWRLVEAGKVPAGVRWVDLREASTAEDVRARFCAALGVKPAGAPVSMHAWYVSG
ncbi:hypothetical protein PLESTF_001084700 [Pleodorina starrii]|nr:hypothetical protein PLESTF_001084700 [Pleodorina starrii]